MRRLVQALAALSVTPVALVLPVLDRPVPKPRPVAPTVREVAVAGIDAESARQIAGYGAPGPNVSRPLALTRANRSASFSALGVTWANGTGTGEVEVVARVRQDGGWTPWHTLDADGDHGPDDTTPDAAGRLGTSPWFTGPADGYQVRIGVHEGSRPRDVKVSLVDPGTSAADGAIGASPVLGRGSVATASIGQPPIVTRAQWGADERLRDGTPSYGDTIKMGFVHHTDSSNTYTAAQAPAMVRSVYAFHTQSRGWSDIGYNFIADKYGRIFEGRYGGVDKPVIGAHTGGFNTDTFAVSLLGSYATVAPAPAQLVALEKMFAWKLGLHYVNPLARTTMTSKGGTKYAAGVQVTLNNVSGHRDAGSTACPGTQTYNRLPSIRSAIKSYMGASLYNPTVSSWKPVYRTTPNVTVKATTPATQAWRLRVRNARTGTTVRTVTGPSTTSISAVWNMRDNAGLLVPPDRYSLELTSWTSASTAKSYVARVEVLSPLPSGAVVARSDGNPYAVVEANRMLGVSPALGRAIRPQPALPGFYGPSTHLAAPTAPARDGMYVKSSAGTGYLVVDGARRTVSSSVASTLGLGTPRAVPDHVLATLPVSSPWTATTHHPDGTVVTSADGAWRLESGVRRPFTSPASRTAWSKGSVVAPATAADLARPVGSPLAPPEGVLMRTATGAGVVSGGTFRVLSDPASLGYTVAAAPLATPDDLAALPAGEPVTTTKHPAGALLKDGSSYVEVLGESRRLVDPALVALDPRVPVAALAGEVKALPGARYVPPSGLAGRAADGTIRVVDSGRLATLPAGTAAALGYAAAALPALEAADFGPLPVGVLNTSAAHPAGTVVKDDGSYFLVDAGARRPLPASLVPTWLGRPALPATAADLALPVGPAAPPSSGAWVVTPDNVRWLVEGVTRHTVSAQVARRLGLDKVTPVAVPTADLTAGTKLGSTIT